MINEKDFEITGAGILTKYTGSGGDVAVPDGVTEIAKDAFCDCETVTSVTVPDSVTKIGEGAFRGCTALASVRLPAGLAVLEEDLFRDCSALSAIEIPDGVTKIADYAFIRCEELTEVVMPESVTEIGKYAFLFCPKRKIIAPEGSFAAELGKKTNEALGAIQRAKRELKLLRRYGYEASEERDEYEDGYAWSASKTFSAIDVYEYNGACYVVSARWSYTGSGDMADSDHHHTLSFKVYRAEIADAENEARVREIAAREGGFKKEASDNIPLNVRDEESFTEGIRPHVIGAIDAFLAEEKKKSAKGKLPNAVKVYKRYAPEAQTIYDFETNAGLGTAFYNCTSVLVKPLGELSVKELGIARPLCYYYPVGRGNPTVSAFRSMIDGRPTLFFRCSNWWDTGESAVICAYEDGNPAPLTPEEVQKILEYPEKG